MTTNTGTLIAELKTLAARLDKDGHLYGGHLMIDHSCRDWTVTVFSDYPIANAYRHLQTEDGKRDFWVIKATNADLDTALREAVETARTGLAIASITHVKVPA